MHNLLYMIVDFLSYSLCTRNDLSNFEAYNQKYKGMKTTEKNSLYTDLEKMSPLEILTNMNT